MEHERGAAVGTVDRPDDEREAGRTGLTRHSRPIRIGAMALTVLLVVGGLLTLRAMVPPAQAAVTATDHAGPDIAHLETFDNARRFDSVRGRTRLPIPQVNGDVVSGGLPAISGPSRAGAGHAVGLVLQRYCAHPARTRVHLADRSTGWWNVNGEVTTAAGRLTISVEWAGPSYIWSGSMHELVACP